MKATLVLYFALMFAVATSFSQVRIGVSTGYILTAYEEQDDSAGTLPIDVQIGAMVTPMLELGGEILYALGGFTFEDNIAGQITETDFHHTQIGAYGKYYVDLGSVDPFVRAGVAYYMGDAELEIPNGQESEQTVEIDPAVGFNFGAGLMATPSLSVEFFYNRVTRDMTDSQDNTVEFGMDTWGFLAGYHFSF